MLDRWLYMHGVYSYDNERPAEPARDHQARVSVPDSVWREFKWFAPESVSKTLGRLVEADVKRMRKKRVANGTIADQHLVEMLGEARRLRDELVQITERLEAEGARRRDGGLW